jgi:hypothetical protein
VVTFTMYIREYQTEKIIDYYKDEFPNYVVVVRE